ncbi:hypothetical protein KM043_007417 [Ampulex compressa]|nr:hypothetical protein KM043_007417 [Ampulex compressa]
MGGCKGRKRREDRDEIGGAGRKRDGMPPQLARETRQAEESAARHPRSSRDPPLLRFHAFYTGLWTQSSDTPEGDGDAESERERRRQRRVERERTEEEVRRKREEERARERRREKEREWGRGGDIRAEPRGRDNEGEEDRRRVKRKKGVSEKEDERAGKGEKETERAGVGIKVEAGKRLEYCGKYHSWHSREARKAVRSRTRRETALGEGEERCDLGRAKRLGGPSGPVSKSRPANRTLHEPAHGLRGEAEVEDRRGDPCRGRRPLSEEATSPTHPTPGFQPPTPNSQHPTPNSQLPTPNSQLPTPN